MPHARLGKRDGDGSQNQNELKGAGRTEWLRLRAVLRRDDCLDMHCDWLGLERPRHHA